MKISLMILCRKAGLHFVVISCFILLKEKKRNIYQEKKTKGLRKAIAYYLSQVSVVFNKAPCPTSSLEVGENKIPVNISRISICLDKISKNIAELKVSA